MAAFEASLVQSLVLQSQSAAFAFILYASAKDANRQRVAGPETFRAFAVETQSCSSMSSELNSSIVPLAGGFFLCNVVIGLTVEWQCGSTKGNSTS